MRTIPTLALFAILLSSAITGAVLLERRDQLRRADEKDIVYLPPPWLARTASLGYRTLLADYYWLQGLQYYGNTHHRRVQFKDLYRFVELVVELDPDFEYAYYFGGTTVPYNRGGWRWTNVDEAVHILERGVERFPESGRLWLLLGYTHSILREDFAAGAEAYRRAADSQGARPWIRSLVTRLEVSSGRLDRARAYAEEVLGQTDDPHLAEAMERRLVELDVESMLQQLDEALSAYAASSGEPAGSLADLVDANILSSLPACPLGGEFGLGPDGAAYSTILEGGRLRAFLPLARQEAEEQLRQTSGTAAPPRDPSPITEQ